LSEKNGGALNNVLRPTAILCRRQRGSRLRIALFVYVMNLLGKKIYWWSVIGHSSLAIAIAGVSTNDK
jgi:hypothetical protein